MTKRLGYLDIAKALCIILVVVGHFCPATTNELWEKVSRAIYSFHMPVFMFISGLLFAHTWKRQSYMEFISKKFQRLMIPYFCTSAVIICIKIAMKGILHVANEVSPKALLEMFWYPSAAIHLWFVWALMIIFIVAAISHSRNYRIAVTAVAAALWLRPFPAPEIFCIDQACNMAVFFMTGVMFRDFGGLKLLDPVSTIQKRDSICIFTCSAITFAVMEVLLFEGTLPKIFERLLPFLGILTVLGISRSLALLCGDGKKGILMTIGGCSFTIYLFHTTFSEFIKAMMSKLGYTLDSHFLPCLVCAVATGIIAPILLQKLVFKKSKALSYLFGVK